MDMMETVRFSKVVQASGKPIIHLLWTDPAKDAILKKAIKVARVMTLHQRSATTRTDYGTIGFEKGVPGQILIFPKSLRRFVGKRVIGVRYDLLEWPDVPNSLQADKPLPVSKALAAEPSMKPRSHKRATPRDKSLREYEARRNYARTPEPRAKPETRKADRKKPHRYVIQKHQASHLHYDFRLEMQGVLRSWAVPKGPPTNLQEARLAMHVEDHPLEYLDFEGTIPQGNYGAGTVMVWDRGEYEEIGDNPVAAFYAGKLHLRMQGTKLKGEWLLLKDREQEASEKWLLIKVGKATRMFSKNEQDRSVLSGRSMSQITQANDAQWQSNRGGASANIKSERSRKTPHEFAASSR